MTGAGRGEKISQFFLIQILFSILLLSRYFYAISTPGEKSVTVVTVMVQLCYSLHVANAKIGYRDREMSTSFDEKPE